MVTVFAYECQQQQQQQQDCKQQQQNKQEGFGKDEIDRLPRCSEASVSSTKLLVIRQQDQQTDQNAKVSSQPAS